MSAAALAQAFSLHNFVEVYDHLAEDIVWNNVGGDRYDGRQAVVDACSAASDYFASTDSEVREVEVLDGPGFVVVKTIVQYTETAGVSTVAACDIYTFDQDVITQITSYNIEL